MIERILREARKQNGWVVKGICLTDLSKGVVMFERANKSGESRFGTAAVITTLLEDDPVAFEWGHYDLTESQATADFIERIKRGY